ncbi:hypothetical protein SAMN02745784_02059 [Tissierella praeacuta DSM 18095]|uniref:Uncharacterized protein n=1 Tax=Tissierella praeacuta DSM 18095 TaxID=1123404 RepID=A0A1M4X0N8_9FIRM|nr:hypothetical protein [Tissierella praeacuta]SHE87049.1 hypothetical protein SAMN02745784_02059 [Tissierella praeacuta DSM 18095]SUO99598.1 Uncharacterised protein [Tissierella praeacuta]
MVESLLFIARDLLCSLDLMEFTEDERDYIIGVVKRIIVVTIIELGKDVMI